MLKSAFQSRDDQETILAAVRELDRLASWLPDREEIASAIRRGLTEEMRNIDTGDRWEADVLLVGCKNVGSRGYEKPKAAAQVLARRAADKVIALLAQPPHQQEQPR